MVIAKLFLIPIFIKMLQKTRKPLWCAVTYAFAIVTNVLIFDLMTKGNWLSALFETVISFALSFVWFFLLNDLEGSDGPYWGVMLVGLGLLLYF